MHSESQKYEATKNRLSILIQMVANQIASDPDVPVPFAVKDNNRDAMLSEIGARWLLTDQSDRKLLQMLLLVYTAGGLSGIVFPTPGGGEDNNLYTPMD